MERRDLARRTDVVRGILTHIVHRPDAAITIPSLQESLNVPSDAAARIIQNLVNARILVPAKPGTWVRVGTL